MIHISRHNEGGQEWSESLAGKFAQGGYMVY